MGRVEAKALSSRIEELKQFEAACRRDEALKVEKRLKVVRDRTTVFAPPTGYDL